MQEEQTKSLSKSALAFFSGTLLSRISGMCRDISMAVFLGTTSALASFMVAYRFANLIRRLFGESSMSSGFIPHFESVRKSSPHEGALFFRDLLASMTLFLIVLLLLLEGILGSFSYLFPSEIITLTMIMLPAALFICLFGILMAFLQCEQQFFLPAAAPIGFNLVWILAVFLIRDLVPKEGIIYLAAAIVLAYLAQLLLLLPATLRYFKTHLLPGEFIRCHFFSEHFRRLVAPFLLAIGGIGANQINSALDPIFARWASLEGPAYLWYAIRLEQLPLALFGIALSSALLPSISRAFNENQLERYRELLAFALKQAFALIFPCMIAFFIIGKAGLSLVYGHGDFSIEATKQTTYALWGYGMGLVPSVFVLILAPAFYGKKDYRTPMAASILSVIVNLILNSIFVFVFGLGAFSVALATSISAFVNCAYLARKIVPLDLRELRKSFVKVGVITLLSGGIVFYCGSQLFIDPYPRLFKEQAVQFLFLGLAYGGLLLLLARVFHVKEITDLLKILKK